ncbi:hypothetical protein MMC27_008637 [Xylographa pallens]|nr:hypothetical protein [Xylographa pallens]
MPSGKNFRKSSADKVKMLESIPVSVPEASGSAPPRRSQRAAAPEAVTINDMSDYNLTVNIVGRNLTSAEWAQEDRKPNGKGLAQPDAVFRVEAVEEEAHDEGDKDEDEDELFGTTEEMELAAMIGDMVPSEDEYEDTDEDKDDGEDEDEDQEWDKGDETLVGEINEEDTLEGDTLGLTDDDEVSIHPDTLRFAERVRYIITGLMMLASSLDADKFQHRQPISFQWWRFLTRKLDIEWLMEKYLNAVPRNVQLVLGKLSFTRDDLRGLPSHWKTPLWGVYLNVLTRDSDPCWYNLYVGSATGIQEQSSNCGLRGRISTYTGWIKRRDIKAFDANTKAYIKHHNGAHARAVFTIGTSIHPVVLAKFQHSESKRIKDYKYSHAVPESFEWVQQCKPVDIEPILPEIGLNREWPVNQRFMFTKGSIRVCSNCSTLTSAGRQWFLADPRRPEKIICSRCYTYRWRCGRDRPVSLELEYQIRARNPESWKLSRQLRSLNVCGMCGISRDQHFTRIKKHFQPTGVKPYYAWAPVLELEKVLCGGVPDSCHVWYVMKGYKSDRPLKPDTFDTDWDSLNGMEARNSEWIKKKENMRERRQIRRQEKQRLDEIQTPPQLSEFPCGICGTFEYKSRKAHIKSMNGMLLCYTCSNRSKKQKSVQARILAVNDQPSDGPCVNCGEHEVKRKIPLLNKHDGKFRCRKCRNALAEYTKRRNKLESRDAISAKYARWETEQNTNFEKSTLVQNISPPLVESERVPETPKNLKSKRCKSTGMKTSEASKPQPNSSPRRLRKRQRGSEEEVSKDDFEDKDTIRVDTKPRPQRQRGPAQQEKTPASDLTGQEAGTNAVSGRPKRQRASVNYQEVSLAEIGRLTGRKPRPSEDDSDYDASRK